MALNYIFDFPQGLFKTEELNNDELADLRAYLCLLNTVLGKVELHLAWVDERIYREVGLQYFEDLSLIHI